MLNFLKKLFSISPSYGMGALQSPADYRNIKIASVQTPEIIPANYETTMPPVENQGQKPKCVGSSISKIAELYLSKDSDNWLNLSDDDLYEQCKLIDGISDVGGTYPSIGAKVACNSGIATVEAYNSKDKNIIKESRAENKLKSYAFVASDFNEICQTIYQNKAISATFSVSSDWFIGIITKVLTIIGRHCIVLTGYDISQKILRGQNSWGVNWVGYIAGKINKSIEAGHFEVLWEDYKNNITDIISFVAIPDEILKEVRKQDYVFTSKMKFGSSGYEVKKLQEKLNYMGYDCGTPDGKFGAKTHRAVYLFQKFNLLDADGKVGPKTLLVLNWGDVYESKLDLWADAIKTHEGWYVGSRSYRNNNPGNLKFIGQDRAKGKDTGGFCIFGSYNDGLQELKDMLTRCATLPDSSTYKADMTLIEFFKVYAPASDNNNPIEYAKFVASKIGCEVGTQIKNLI